MNSQKKEQEQPTENEIISFGDQIRRAREARQLTVEDLVGETRIHPQHLIDIEQGKTSGISATGYVVGYLRTLAKVLELDAEQLVSDYEKSLNAEDQQIIDPDHELLPLPRKKNSVGWILGVAITVIVVAGLGTLGYFLWDNMNTGSSTTPQDEPETDEQAEFDDGNQSLAEAPLSVNSNLLSNVSDDSQEMDSDAAGREVDESSKQDDANYNTESSEVDSSVSLTNADQSTEMPSNGEMDSTVNLTDVDPPIELPAPDWTDLMGSPSQEGPDDFTSENSRESSEGSAELESVASVPDESEQGSAVVVEAPAPLVLEFSDTSYVEVSDGDDNQLISDTKDAGTKLELDGKEPFTVKLGFAPGVTVFFHGEEIELSQYTSRNIAEFTLPQ